MPEASVTSTPTAPTGTGTTIPSIALDTHQEDDVLVIQAGWRGNQAPTVLTDWTHWFTNTTGTATNGCGQGWWWRRVGAGETVSSPTLTIGATAVERKAISYRIRGADIDNPANMFWLKQQTVGNSATPTPPGITTLEPNYLIIHGVTCRGNSGVTPPTGYSEEEDLPEGTTICVEGSSKVQATQTTLTGQAATISSNRWVAAIIAIPSKDYVKFRSQTSQTAASVTRITGTAPTGVTNDDFYDQADGLLAIVKAAGTGVNITAQDGTQWTKLTDFDREISGADTVALFEAHAQSSNTWGFDRPSSGNMALQLVALRNVHQTDFIGNLHSRQNSGTPAPWDAQSRQNTKSTVYGIVICDADTNNVNSAPSGYTERSDGVGIGICDQVFEGAGTTASANWTTANAANVTGLIEILSVSGVSSVLTLSVSDSLSAWSDAASTQLIGVLTLSLSDDAANLADSVLLEREHRLAFGEAINAFLNDGCSLSAGISVSLTDSFNPSDFSDDFALTVEGSLEFSDNFTLTDSLSGLGYGLAPNEPPASRKTLSDAFTDTDGTALTSHTPTEGTAWVQPSYGSSVQAIVNSNRATKASSAGQVVAYLDDSVSADCYVQGKVRFLGAPSGSQGGIVLRLDSASEAFYTAQHERTGMRWTIRLGDGTSLGVYPEVLTVGEERLVRFECIGTTLRLVIDGSERLRVTDSTRASGFAGIRLNDTSGVAGYAVDDFEAGVIPAINDNLAFDLQEAEGGAAIERSFTDNALNLNDAHELRLAHLFQFTELLSLSDEHEQQLEHRAVFTDSLAQSDAAVIVLGHEVPLADNALALNDSLSLGNGLAVIDALTLTDAYIQILGYELLFTDSFTLTDSYAQVLSHLLSFADDVNALADTLDLILGHLATFSDDANNLADFSQLQLGHLLSLNDVVVLTDSESQILSYLISFSDDANNLVDHIVLDLQGVTDERTINVQDSFTLTDEASLNLSHLLSLDDAIVLSDDSALQQEQLVEFADTFSLTDTATLNLHHSLQLSDVIVLTDEASVDLSAREQVFADSLSQQDSITLVLGHWISTDDGLQQVDSVVVVVTGPERLVDEFDSLNNWADSLVLDVGEIGGFEIVLTDSFVLTDHEFILRGPYTPSQKRKTVVPLRARTTIVPKRKDGVTV